MEEIQDLKESLQAFLKRKEKNRTTILKRGYEADINERYLVKTTKTGKIKKTACAYCFADTNINPYKNCATGVFAFPICSKCIVDCADIEDYLTGGKVVKKRKSKQDPKNIEIDWQWFERLVENNEAKVVILAQKFNIYPAEMKQLIIDKYGKNNVEFKRGRTGGIILKTKCQE